MYLFTIALFFIFVLCLGKKSATIDYKEWFVHVAKGDITILRFLQLQTRNTYKHSNYNNILRFAYMFVHVRVCLFV